MQDMIERLRRIPTATVCDAYLRLKIRPVDRIVVRNVLPLDPAGGIVVGRARTQQMVVMRDPERGSLIADRRLHFELVDAATPGDFLVVAVAGRERLASFGDVLAMKAHAQGVSGAVIDSAVRDVGVIRGMGLPLWCDGVTPIPQGYGGYSVESVNTPVTCGGVEVNPGDLMVGDSDGVVVIPLDELEAVLTASEELEAAEEHAREGIQQGRPLEELYPSRAYYAKAKETAP